MRQCLRAGRRGTDDPIRRNEAKARRSQPEALAGIRAQLGARSIVLVGMPGSGKSAVGRRLAARLELPFVDADEEIERAAGKPITDIFNEHGEAYFREGERKVIARLLRGGPAGAGDRRRRADGGGDARQHSPVRDLASGSRPSCRVLMRRVLKRNNRPLLEKDPEARHAPS